MLEVPQTTSGLETETSSRLVPYHKHKRAFTETHSRETIAAVRGHTAIQHSAQLGNF